MKKTKTLPIKSAAPIGIGFGDLFGANGFVFLDDRPWPYLVTDKTGEWWLNYWSEGNKNFVTLRKLTLDEVNHFRAHALPPEKAALYAKVASENQPRWMKAPNTKVSNIRS